MVESVPGGELAPLVDQHRGLGATVVGKLHSTVITVQYLCTVQLSQCSTFVLYSYHSAVLVYSTVITVYSTFITVYNSVQVYSRV